VIKEFDDHGIAPTESEWLDPLAVNRSVWMSLLGLCLILAGVLLLVSNLSREGSVSPWALGLIVGGIGLQVLAVAGK
jgi:hypothetical protein